MPQHDQPRIYPDYTRAAAFRQALAACGEDGVSEAKEKKLTIRKLLK